MIEQSVSDKQLKGVSQSNIDRKEKGKREEEEEKKRRVVGGREKKREQGKKIYLGEWAGSRLGLAREQLSTRGNLGRDFILDFILYWDYIEMLGYHHTNLILIIHTICFVL